MVDKKDDNKTEQEEVETTDESSEVSEVEEDTKVESSEAEETASEDETSEAEASDLPAKVVEDSDDEDEDDFEDDDELFDEFLGDDDSEEEEDEDYAEEEDDSEIDDEDDLDDEISDAYDDDLDEDSDVDDIEPATEQDDSQYEGIDGLAAYFDDPNELLHAAAMARDEGFDKWDAYSPFPIHGIEDAMGLGRSWLPWVTFAAGLTGFTLANLLQFGTLTFDWPMIIGGKPYAPWPSFVPIMFELTVLIGGVTTALVMLIASGCFRKPKIIDPEITNDRFVLWVSAEDSKFDPNYVKTFMKTLDPVEIRPIKFD